MRLFLFCVGLYLTLGILALRYIENKEGQILDEGDSSLLFILLWPLVIFPALWTKK